MSSYFKPVQYKKDQKDENFFKSKNLFFFGNSIIFPSLPFIVAFLLVFTQIIIPIYFITSADNMPKIAQKTVLGYSSGYRDYEFSELKSKTEISVKDLNPDKASASQTQKPEFFYLSIPKLKIYNAMVETDSTNLSPDNYIGHYNGSSYPGMPGTSYLYGHSVLPFFYNPRSYKTIFSKLDDLSKGDEIIVNYNNKNFVYKVKNSVELAIKDVNPLQNKNVNDPNSSTLVLMTCWPAGSKAKRFEVLADLVN